MSNLELYFIKNVIIFNNLHEKFDIVYEYKFYNYYIDFVFLNINLAVEIDGKQHFIKYKQYSSDINKNNLLLKHKWDLYRIPFFELNPVDIYKFLQFINSKSIEDKKLENFIYYNHPNINKNNIKIFKQLL